jgi:catechol 2,3-dioxygenase-like lactoylglutathione lyase family enzyme
MEFHRGRLVDHIHLHAKDLATTKLFYKAIATALGLEKSFIEFDNHFIFDELFVDGDRKAPETHIHLAFQAADRDTVERFYEAGLAAGGRDNGAPGERPYHPGYFSAYLLDPDGNNIEAVFHGPSKRSAASVVIEPA